MKIYTKTGDKGETSLFGGKRVSKSSTQIEAYGAIDELNSFIGLAISISNIKEVKQNLFNVQNDLLAIGAYLSGYPKLKLDLDDRTLEIEKTIDKLDTKLPALRNFILPGGDNLASALHVARTVSRRAERRVISYFDQSQSSKINQHGKLQVIKYLNRLSDFLFVLARFSNQTAGKKETIWRDES